MTNINQETKIYSKEQLPKLVAESGVFRLEYDQGYESGEFYIHGTAMVPDTYPLYELLQLRNTLEGVLSQIPEETIEKHFQDVNDGSYDMKLEEYTK